MNHPSNQNTFQPHSRIFIAASYPAATTIRYNNTPSTTQAHSPPVVPSVPMATTVIARKGNLTVEVIEYDDKARDGNGNRLVKKKQQFRVRREVLTKQLKLSHWKEAQQDLVQLKEDSSIASMDIWFRILHDTDMVHDVPLEEMWSLVAACDKHQFDLDMLKPWFATWYQKHGVNQYYTNWDIKNKSDTYLLDPRSLLYPCWKFDHAEGFMRATHFLSYNSVGHITEYNPTIYLHLRLENRIIRKLSTDLTLLSRINAANQNSSTPQKAGFEQLSSTSFSVQMRICSRHGAIAKRKLSLATRKRSGQSTSGRSSVPTKNPR